MNIEILKRPGNACARVTLGPGEDFTAQAGAMIAMSPDMTLTTSTHKKGQGGVMKALKRMLAGETFFLNHFAPGAGGGELYLAPTLPGDLMVYDLQDETLIVQGGSYLACGEGVQVDTGWQGLKSLFAGESLFWLKLSGTGPVLLSSFGCIYSQTVRGEYIVDTGHIVAFQPGLTFNITKPQGSWLSAFLGGEGFVCRFKGEGNVWCQSHNPAGFGGALGPMLLPVER